MVDVKLYLLFRCIKSIDPRSLSDYILTLLCLQMVKHHPLGRKREITGDCATLFIFNPDKYVIGC